VPERLRRDWIWWAAALTGVVLMSIAGLRDFAWSDYDSEAAPAFAALVNGDIGGFLALSPAYGGSLVLRAPLAAVTGALGGGDLAIFRAVSLPCLLALAGLGLVLARMLLARDRSRGLAALVLGLCVLNPIALRALEIGHPEELLCTALSIGAVLAASSRRALLAAILLGLAIATKAWAVLAIGPVLLALPGGRLRAFVIAGSVTTVVLAPIMLAGSPQAMAAGASQTGQLFNPWQIFWLFGDPSAIGNLGVARVGARVPPEWLSPLTHPLIAMLVVPLSLLWWRVHRHERRANGEQLLALLALLLLVRCVLDPWNTVYYEMPFLLSLLAWETLCRTGRPPVVSLAAMLATWFTFEQLEKLGASGDVLCIVFLSWSLPLIAFLAREVYGLSPRRAGMAFKPRVGRLMIATRERHRL
jgi:hypothetical protein